MDITELIPRVDYHGRMLDWKSPQRRYDPIIQGKGLEELFRTTPKKYHPRVRQRLIERWHYTSKEITAWRKAYRESVE